MIGIRINLVQASAQAPTAADVSREQLKQDIRQTVRDAQDAVRSSREAAQAAREHRVIVGPMAPVLAPGIPPMPGHTVEQFGFDNSNLIPSQAVDIAQGFFVMLAIIVVGFPLARAFGKRIERRGETTPAISPALTDQLQRIEHAVESMAIEVERISESQRFMVKLQSGASPGLALPHERS